MDTRKKTELLVLLTRLTQHIPKDKPELMQETLAFCDTLRDELTGTQAADDSAQLSWLEQMHNVPGKQCSSLGFHIISPSPRGWTLDREFGGQEVGTLREAIQAASVAK